jgi:Ethanolamine utilization protein, possible chaperonin
LTDTFFGRTEPGDDDSYLALARTRIAPGPDGSISPLSSPPEGELYVGVDLGTAYLVLVVLDAKGMPLAGEYQFASVVRDGLVVDYIGAVDRLRGHEGAR